MPGPASEGCCTDVITSAMYSADLGNGQAFIEALEARNRALVEALERLVAYVVDDNPGRAVADAETASL